MMILQIQGHSCEIGNISLAGTLKSQNPQLLKKLLFWLSCPCLHCLWWEKNNRPPYCTFYKSRMPHSQISNVPAWQIFSISCVHVANSLYFAQIICNWCNKDTIHMWDHPKALLPSYNVPGIMSPRNKNFLILVWWLAKCFCLFSWTIVIAEFCFVITLKSICSENSLEDGRYSWQQENWSREYREKNEQVTDTGTFPFFY